MRPLLWGSMLLCAAFAIHYAVWRLRLPRRQNKTLLEIFFGTLLSGLCIMRILHGLGTAFDHYLLQGIAEHIQASVLFLSCTFAYMITYSAIEVDSPSLLMTLAIAQAGADGIDKSEFEARMTDDILTRPRLQDLITDHMTRFDGKRYILTKKGAMVARIFVTYRRMLNLDKGG